MKIIYKPDDGRITVAEAKRLIYNALPKANAAEVYMHVDADGNPVWDGPIEIKEVPEADLFELNEVVLDMCQQGLITPRFRYRPTRTDYIGNSDDAYLLDHADFVVMAQMLECRVIVGEAPATRETENPAPAIPESASNETEETPKERRHRWLAFIEHEEKQGRAWGALARLSKSEGVDRSNMGKAIAKAREERADERRSGEWTSQLMSAGKR